MVVVVVRWQNAALRVVGLRMGTRGEDDVADERGDGDGDETGGGRRWLTLCVWAEGGRAKRGERRDQVEGQSSFSS